MIKIKVTQKDINNGSQSSITHCAISCALKKELYINTVTTTLDGCGLHGLCERSFYLRPVNTEDFHKFIRNFDSNRNSVKPIEFVFEIK